MKHIVQFSGGIQSWAAAKRIVIEFGPDDLTLLFADTKMEDEDLYRFIKEAAANIGGKFITLADGRTPWEVFFDEGMMGKPGVDPCSRILKRELLDKWRKENTTPENSIFYVGIGHQEHQRLYGNPAKGRPGLIERFKPWIVKAPLCDRPFKAKGQIMCELKKEGIEIPRLYKLRFPHNNCGGFCIKAGQAQFKNLLDKMPERYAYHEQKEKEFRAKFGDYSILKNKRKGEPLVLSLEAFRKQVEMGIQQDAFDDYDWGGCGCAVD